MFSIARSIAIATLAVTAAAAADFGPLMEVAKATWPEKKHLGVIADYSRSAEAIQELANEAGEGMLITVVDCRDSLRINSAEKILLARVKPDILVLLPEDPQIHDGTFQTTLTVGHASLYGVPTIATKPISIRQGAVFAIGPDTGMELLLTTRMKGTVDVILPTRATIAPKVSMVRTPAAIRVLPQ